MYGSLIISSLITCCIICLGESESDFCTQSWLEYYFLIICSLMVNIEEQRGTEYIRETPSRPFLAMKSFRKMILCLHKALLTHASHGFTSAAYISCERKLQERKKSFFGPSYGDASPYLQNWPAKPWISRELFGPNVGQLWIHVSCSKSF